MTLASPGSSAQSAGWLHGRDSAVLARAADAFGLSLDALRMLSTLKALGSVLDQLEANAWAAVGLTSAQGWVLTELVLIGPCPQHVLAQRLLVTPSSISQVASRLASQDLLTRRPDGVDRRVRHLAATDKAVPRVRAVVPLLRDALETAEAALGARQVRQLLEHLAVLNDALSRQAPKLHTAVDA